MLILIEQAKKRIVIMALKDRLKTLVNKIVGGTKIDSRAVERAKQLIEAAKREAKK